MYNVLYLLSCTVYQTELEIGCVIPLKKEVEAYNNNKYRIRILLESKRLVLQYKKNIHSQR